MNTERSKRVVTSEKVAERTTPLFRRMLNSQNHRAGARRMANCVWIHFCQSAPAWGKCLSPT
ncbi:hypothetical protein NL440_26505, partial [Klebsiella pneumoniae]|nr:hypothetical protein [Klebsiella pneumoniae]